MGKGLFKSIYGKTDEGIYPDLYTKHGTSSGTKRTDIRLGDYEYLGDYHFLGEEDDDDDDEEEGETSPGTPATTDSTPGGPSVFSKDKEGFPMWVAGIFFLGFALAWRQRKKKQ
jgi:hypothetical protein